jgi:oxygen-independent coproporphyrinogen-3 oxidase
LGSEVEETTVGSYFVSNYPPYSFWSAQHTPEAREALERSAAAGTALGVYLHIPFCRKRCTFCYFKVYTDKNSTEVQTYLDAAIEEMKLFARKPFISGRKPKFIYFGGGTPSYISSKQLEHLVAGMKKHLSWDGAEEVAFECEPGTLTEGKLRAIKEMGTTRLSLGVENFNEEILRNNGRAHGAKEIGRAYDYARTIGFPQINIDLIAGMVGETEENWRENIRQLIELSPEMVTIYQMEIPGNTVIFNEMKAAGQKVAPVAGWGTKREWLRYAFAELEKAGYTVTSATTAVKDPSKHFFLYREYLWRGADMIGLGVASFSHVGGVHFQNDHEFESYVAKLEKGELPIYRALTPNEEERLIREFILQMKFGWVSRDYFRKKFNADVRERFGETLGEFREKGLLQWNDKEIRLTRDGLLCVDELIHEFFLPQHREVMFA